MGIEKVNREKAELQAEQQQTTEEFDRKIAELQQSIESLKRQKEEKMQIIKQVKAERAQKERERDWEISEKEKIAKEKAEAEAAMQQAMWDVTERLAPHLGTESLQAQQEAETYASTGAGDA